MFGLTMQPIDETPIAGQAQEIIKEEVSVGNKEEPQVVEPINALTANQGQSQAEGHGENLEEDLAGSPEILREDDEVGVSTAQEPATTEEAPLRKCAREI
jgi:hypothetical protein